jgi:molybdopterin-guanine dinucleotide biosynthesis protein A
VTGIVLAGGQSKRLGTAKALLRLGNETFLERTVSVLRGVCQHIIVVSDPGSPLAGMDGCTMATDERPGLGPLGGLVTGLAVSDDEWHLALACDLPLVRPAVLHLLIAESAGVEAVVPRAGGRLQPLLAAYSRGCLVPARAALDSGRRAMTALLDRVRVKIIEERHLREVDADLVSFTNVNSWEDYQLVISDRWRA